MLCSLMCHVILWQTHQFQLVKSFTLLSLLGKMAIFILAPSVSLHYNVYENRVKLATVKVSYLVQRKRLKLVLMIFFAQGNTLIKYYFPHLLQPLPQLPYKSEMQTTTLQSSSQITTPGESVNWLVRYHSQYRSKLKIWTVMLCLRSVSIALQLQTSVLMTKEIYSSETSRQGGICVIFLKKRCVAACIR